MRNVLAVISAKRSFHKPAALLDFVCFADVEQPCFEWMVPLHKINGTDQQSPGMNFQ